MRIKEVVTVIIIAALFAGGCQSAQAWGRKEDKAKNEQPLTQQTPTPGAQINFNVSVANKSEGQRDTSAVAVNNEKGTKGKSRAEAYGYLVEASAYNNAEEGDATAIADEISKNKPEEKSGRKRVEAYNPFNLLTAGPVQMTCGSWN